MPNKAKISSTNKQSFSNRIAKKPRSQKKVEKAVILPKTLSSTVGLFKNSFKIIKFQSKFFSISLLMYVLLSVFFVINISSFTGITATKNSYIHGLSTIGSNLSASLSTLGSVSGTVSSSNSSSGSVIQFLLFLLFSLVFIKGIREANKSRQLRFSEGIYSSTYPFVQFMLVMMLLALEFIPSLLSLFLTQTIFTNGIAANVPEKIIWLAVCLLLFIVGIYLVFSTIFALFITTLPDMRPWASVKSSWKIVKNKRMLISRKILAMFVTTLILLGLIALILILIIPAISAWILLILGSMAILFVYTYLYSLYKELI